MFLLFAPLTQSLEAQMPEFVEKREQTRLALLAAAASPAPAAAAPQTAEQKAAQELLAVKSKLWANTSGTVGGKASEVDSDDSESLVKGGDGKKRAMIADSPATILASKPAAGGNYNTAVERATERAQKALDERQKQAERDAKWAKFAPKVSICRCRI